MFPGYNGNSAQGEAVFGNLLKDQASNIEQQRSFLCNESQMLSSNDTGTNLTTNASMTVWDFQVQAFYFRNSSSGEFDNGELSSDVLSLSLSLSIVSQYPNFCFLLFHSSELQWWTHKCHCAHCCWGCSSRTGGFGTSCIPDWSYQEPKTELVSGPFLVSVAGLLPVVEKHSINKECSFTLCCMIAVHIIVVIVVHDTCGEHVVKYIWSLNVVNFLFRGHQLNPARNLVPSCRGDT